MRARKRLRVITDLVDLPNAVIADIGADHGFLSKMLIDEGRASKVIATDISAPSLQKTIDLVKQYNLEEKIECRVGDGLTPIEKNEVDLAVIAGMGGFEIINILETSKGLGVKNFIFQPVQNTVDLRKYLVKNKFNIVKDFIICDKNKFYNTIQVEGVQDKYKASELDVEFGKDNVRFGGEDFKIYLEKYILNCKAIIIKSSDNVVFNEKLLKALGLYQKLYNK